MSHFNSEQLKKDRDRRLAEEEASGLPESNINKTDKEREEFWEEFMPGIDPAWHEYKGPIKQDD